MRRTKANTAHTFYNTKKNRFFCFVVPLTHRFVRQKSQIYTNTPKYNIEYLRRKKQNRRNMYEHEFLRAYWYYDISFQSMYLVYFVHFGCYWLVEAAVAAIFRWFHSQRYV